MITGQGGQPPTPREIIRNETATLLDLGNPLSDAIAAGSSEKQNSAVALAHTTIEPPIVEAEGWQRDDNGTVVLVAQMPISSEVKRNDPAPCTRPSR